MMLGMAAKQLGEECERAAQRPGAHLGEEDRHPDGQGNSNQQRQERRNQRAINKRKGAEVPVDRIPVDALMRVRVDVGLVEEVEPKLEPGQVGLPRQLRSDQHHDPEDAERAQHHQPLESPVGQRGVPARKQKSPHLRIWSGLLRRFRDLGRRCRLQTWLRHTNLWHVINHLDQANRRR